MKVNPVRDKETEIDPWAYCYEHPTCEVCTRRPTTTAHHIVYRSQGGLDEPCNLLAVCPWCHVAIHDGDRHRNLTLGEVLSIKQETGDWDPERLEWMRRLGNKGLPELKPIPEWVLRTRERNRKH